jgi:hypothetical protein
MAIEGDVGPTPTARPQQGKIVGRVITGDVIQRRRPERFLAGEVVDANYDRTHS